MHFLRNSCTCCYQLKTSIEIRHFRRIIFIRTFFYSFDVSLPILEHTYWTKLHIIHQVWEVIEVIIYEDTYTESPKNCLIYYYNLDINVDDTQNYKMWTYFKVTSICRFVLKTIMMIGVLAIITQCAGNGAKISCGTEAIKKPMGNLTVKPGENASFKCEIDILCIVDNIEWCHKTNDGSVILLKRDQNPTESYSYFNVTGVQAKDEGVYTCIVGDESNESNQAESSAALVLNNGNVGPASPTSLFMTLCLSMSIFMILLR